MPTKAERESMNGNSYRREERNWPFFSREQTDLKQRWKEKNKTL